MANTLYRPLLQTLTIHSATFRFARYYGRWMHRNPAKVILPFEPKDNVQLRKEKVIELDSDFFKKTPKKETIQKSIAVTSEESLQNKVNFKEVKDKKESLLKKRLFYLSQKKVFDDNNEIIYEKLKDNDSKIR